MRLKSFYAKTMTEAMQLVRESLGEDAIIIATREEDGGKTVRVTAALEDDFPLPPAKSRSIAFELGRDGVVAEDDSWLQYDDEQDQDSSLTEAIIDVLLKHAAPEDVLDQIVNCAEVLHVDEPSVAFVGALDQLFNFTPLPSASYKKALMFVGPPGAGKTLAVAKQAAQAVIDGLDIGVISTDTLRAGGIEQLNAFTKLLDIKLKTVRSAADLKTALAELSSKDQILIDTPGINPFAPSDMTMLARLIAAGPIEPIMVLAAAGDATESGEMARIFSALGARRLVATRLDIARRLGGLLAAAQQGGMAFANASTSAGAADGFAPMTPRKLASFFFPAETQSQSSSSSASSHRPTSRQKTTG